LLLLLLLLFFLDTIEMEFPSVRNRRATTQPTLTRNGLALARLGFEPLIGAACAVAVVCGDVFFRFNDGFLDAN